MRLPGLSYVVNSLNPGGTERLVLQMSRAFSNEFRVQVLCLDVPGAWADELRRDGIAVHCLWRQPGLDTAIPMRLARHFRQHDTDIIHAHQCTPWFYSALSRLIHSRPKLILEEHGRFYPEAESRVRVLVNRVLIRHLTHRFVAVSKDISARLVRYEGLRAADIEVIYNGVSPEEGLSADERAKLRAELGFSSKCYVVGTVGRFDPIKNLPMLVESLVAVGQGDSSICGLLIGDGPAINDIQARVARSPMRDRIRLTGYRVDARRLAQCLDLFVLPSFSEGTSMALLEAMYLGLPTIVTDVGGNPEVVVDGETGWVVPSGAMDELSRALIEARHDGPERVKRAAAGRQRFHEHFRMEQMIESYRHLYAAIAEPSDRSRLGGRA